MLDAVSVGAKNDFSFRYGVHRGRDILVPIIRPRKPFPQAVHSMVTSRMRGEKTRTLFDFADLWGIVSLSKEGNCNKTLLLFKA